MAIAAAGSIAAAVVGFATSARNGVVPRKRCVASAEITPLSLLWAPLERGVRLVRDLSSATTLGEKWISSRVSSESAPSL